MLKKIITFTMFSICLALPVLAFSEDNISALEYAKYGTNYPYESLGERLNRLETDYFGMAQTGDIEDRLSNLSKVNNKAHNSVNLPTNGSFYNTKPKSKLKSFLDDLTSGFSDNGYMTGFTPSMNTFSSSGYSNNINNPPNYCPYGIHNRSSILHNRYFNNRNFPPNYNHLDGVNRFIQTPMDNQNLNIPPHYKHHHRNNNKIYPSYRPYTNYTRYYSPPNVQTKSSIHILRD